MKPSLTFTVSRQSVKYLLKNHSDDELKKMLQFSIDTEDYESASVVQEVIDDRFHDHVKGELLKKYRRI